MSGNKNLDTSIAIRLLNGDEASTQKALALPAVILLTAAVGEFLYGKENSNRSLQNTSLLEFIETCAVALVGNVTAATDTRTRLALKRKGRHIPMNDIWIADQCLENGWMLLIT